MEDDLERAAGDAIQTRELEANVAWAAAARERDVAQTRIVHAFRHHLEFGGGGPDEADLLLFARAAIAEQRLARSSFEHGRHLSRASTGAHIEHKPSHPGDCNDRR